MNDIKIYKRYLEIKKNKGKVGDIFSEFSISRQTLYDVIRRVETGNTKALRRCMNLGKLECIWEHKYKIRFLMLPKDRSATTVKQLQKIIFQMKDDGFPIYLMADKLGKERSTIIHHLAKK